MAGVAGSALGCPFYMVKTQIQAQSYGRYAVGFQHNHTGTVSALKSAYNLKGVRGLWKGVEGIVPRTAVGSAIQLSTFTSCKDFFMQYEVSAQFGKGCSSNFDFSHELNANSLFTDFPKIDIFNRICRKYGQWILFGCWYDPVRCGSYTPLQSR